MSEFIRRFETDSREIYAQRQKIVESIGLRPGMAVADIGSGTGLFAWLFAEKVGTKGKVYAVEIAPAFLKYINDQSTRRGLDKVVQTVRSTQETTNLAPGSIDVAFVCATYHHFEHPKRILSSIHQASDRVDGLWSSTSISARTAAISSGHEHVLLKRSTSRRSRQWASDESRRSTRSI